MKWLDNMRHKKLRLLQAEFNTINKMLKSYEGNYWIVRSLELEIRIEKLKVKLNLK